MKAVDNYKDLATLNDYHRNPYSKTDCIKLIRKFLRNEDGSVPTTTSLRKLGTRVFAVWMKNAPSDIWKQFHFIGE